MKKRKWSKAYTKYREAYYREKKRGNIRKHQIVMSQEEFKEAQKEGFTGSQMLREQKIFKTKEQERKVWREYKFMRKFYSRGETIDTSVEHFTSEGDTETENLELRYHYSLSGLMHDRYAIHFMISFRLDAGEERKSVLADYGY